MGNKERVQSKIDKEELKKRIESKLFSRGITQSKDASAEQLYQATVGVLKDVIAANRAKFKKRMAASDGKKVCYLCMEFLIGRSLKNNALNLGLYETLSTVLTELGFSFEEVEACEKDPGLGNGGLGRLAACFMDSLTALEYPAGGYSLFYENGLFRQRLVDGEQVELPDLWLAEGGSWLIPRPERSVTVRFGGEVEEVWEREGLKIQHTDYDEVRAVPYDIMIVGAENEAVNTLRLWRAREAESTAFSFTTQGTYLRAMSQNTNVTEITRQLYPPDNHDEGKLLRLTQQYFLVSASLQSIIRDYFVANGSLVGFEEKVAIHINDTHPTLCIPELMRILMDVYSYSWEDAWRTVTRSVTYTNHTVMPEALEAWRVDLFKMKLPRIFGIVNEINSRFCADLWNMYPGDWDRISRMAVIAYGQVRMANLSVLASHTVNGVSALHSEILKKTVFHDFYKMTPWKFTNVTNGVVHRRWLCAANPGLSSLLNECIGDGYVKEPRLLEKFLTYSEDASVNQRLGQIKRENKERFCAYAKEKTGRILSPDSIFDVQIKRLHEYKRQLLNALKIMALSLALRANPNADIPAQTFIFGAKAAPGYVMAKQIIKLIYFLGEELEKDPLTRDRLKVVFMEDYNVSMAEVLIPASEISEQISLAGKEASGTGNMKLMMNGALTLGTLDGANVEILDAVGRENIYIFGMNTGEVDELWRSGYDAKSFYRSSDRLHEVVERLYHPIGGQSFSHIADYLINGTGSVADPFMCLADFDSYFYEQQRTCADYGDTAGWNRRSLVNIAKSGRFASDESIQKYAREIWRIEPVGR